MPWNQFSIKGWPVHVEGLLSMAAFSAALDSIACLFEGGLYVVTAGPCSDLQLW